MFIDKQALYVELRCFETGEFVGYPTTYKYNTYLEDYKILCYTNNADMIDIFLCDSINNNLCIYTSESKQTQTLSFMIITLRNL